MEIANIHIQGSQKEYEWPVGTESKKFDSSLVSLPAGNQNQEPTQKPMAQMISISSSIDYVYHQLQSILTSFPPYFPAGSSERVDLIKGLKGLQEKIEGTPFPTVMKKAAAGPKLTSQATDMEISAALKNLTRFKEFTLMNNTASGTKKPGTVLNLKI
ncbi:MAG: hypothetical protein C0407_12605 [Desulfobacca sp.]|nr:hypothetical protein [Desulfobacca sp.]